MGTFAVRLLALILGIFMVLDDGFTIEGTIPVTYTTGGSAIAKDAKVVFDAGYNHQTITVTCMGKKNETDYDYDHFKLGDKDSDGGKSLWIAYTIIGSIYLVYYALVMAGFIFKQKKGERAAKAHDDLMIRSEWVLDLVLGGLALGIGHHFIPEYLINAKADALLSNSTLTIAAVNQAKSLLYTSADASALTITTDDYANGYHMVYAAGIISLVHCLLVFPLKIFHTRNLDGTSDETRKYYNLGVFPTTGYNGKPPAEKPFGALHGGDGFGSGMRLTDGRKLTPMPNMV